VLVAGIDLAWADGKGTRPPAETGAVLLDPDGTIAEACWLVGTDAVAAWLDAVAGRDCLAMIDAPLVVTNRTGQRSCERQVGQRYGRWKVSANSTNLSSPRLGGVRLRQLLEAEGWRYDHGRAGPPTGGLVMSECYPYTTLVGAPELGYETERPLYKRKPRSMSTAQFRTERASACDELIARLARLESADPPLRLESHPVARTLLTEPSPLDDRAYKHREDLIDAVLCAWTGQLWLRHGLSRCQVLGDEADGDATIIGPARTTQRRPEPGAG
jgi:predicted RNase H-like nuclease